ncbi:hypothetical protein D6C77_07090 [Aureobasidium pullulans]|nr:hypothetical protein D6D29_00582 [Aureobasidium pullulans]THX56819.1 hypothetical protein D6D11_03395 [Aureobasidium pullulans]THX95732.1 hypothetical protein D6D08_01129 [Aureobasidium pullulans]TIA56147.1 hypothetical protein D6C77_07090 [Aureobasidium pullulans]
MSDRADFLAGIAASGCGSMFGIEGDDFGSFDSPYPDPSPPAGFHDDLDHSMSDDDSISCDGSSESSVPVKATKPSKRKKSKLSKALRKAQKSDKKKEQRMLMARKRHEVKMKRRILASNHLSEESKNNLERIANQARIKFGGDVEKKTEHLEWAVKTLNTAGYAYYINLMGIDKEMQLELILLQRKEKPMKAKTLAMMQLNLTKEEKMTLYRETDKKGLTRRQQRQLKATGTFELPYIRPSRKERPTAQLLASQARKDKFKEMVRLSNQKVSLDQETQKQFHAWARLQLGKKWIPKFNALFPVR